MNGEPDQSSSKENSRKILFRVLMFVVAASVVLAVVVASTLLWQRHSRKVASDPYANLPSGRQ